MHYLDNYRDDPAPGSLLRLAETLNDPGGDPAPEEVTAEWLRAEGERQARESLGQVLEGNGHTAVALHRLRGTLTAMGVPCAGWEVTPAILDSALQRHARDEYDQAVQGQSPVHGWRVLKLWAGGLIPGPGFLPPGARDVIMSCSVRHINDQLRENPDDGYHADWVLGELESVLAGLGPAEREEFRRNGLPGDEAAAGHARQVAKSAMYWRKFRDEPGWADRNSHAVLAAVPFRNVLASKTMTAAEIGAADRDMTEAARAWTARCARRITDGDYNAFDTLHWFVTHSKLGWETFGISSTQAGRWREEQARYHWKQALAGDGDAALRVICHCEDGHGTYASVSGLTDTRARAALQATLTAWPARLRKQLQSAPGTDEAAHAYSHLRDLADLAAEINRIALEAGRPRPIDPAPLPTMPDEDWHALYDHYVRRR